jgi:hypothetical protein
MNRSRATATVGSLAVGLMMVGFVMVGLSYGVVLPTWPAFTFAAVAAATVCVGIVLCFPYLKVGNKGFVLGPAAGTPPRWLAAFVIIGGIAMVLLMVTSGYDHGSPGRSASGAYVLDYKGTVTVVSRAEWLRASARQARVLSAISNLFLCITALWCAACARARTEPSVTPP